MNIMNDRGHDPYREFHPYPPFVPPTAIRLIVGSFPPIKLTRKIEDDRGDPIIKAYNDYLLRNPKTGQDYDFYYGSSRNLFWKIFGELYNTELPDLKSIKNLLTATDTAVTDILELCIRKLFDHKKKRYILPSTALSKSKPEDYTVSSGDNNLHPLLYRDIPAILRDNPQIKELIFTSRYVAGLFARNFVKVDLLPHGQATFITPDKKEIKITLLPSPSGAANVTIGQLPEFKNRKKQNPRYNTYQYRLDVYRKALKG